LASCFDQEWINMNEIRMEPERLSRPYLTPTPPPRPVPPRARSVMTEAGTRGLRAGAGVFFLVFCPGAYLYGEAWLLWLSKLMSYSPAPAPLPAVATAANLLTAVILYSAARIIEGVHSALARRPP
jgi:hypothetical protein